MKFGDKKEHYDLLSQFEKDFKGEIRLDRENIEYWKLKRIYQDGKANKIFLAYYTGYSYGKSIAMQNT